MTFDSDGYESGGAPATEGTITIKDAGDGKYTITIKDAGDGKYTITIKDAGDGKYTIEFELKDDDDPKHTIKALWTGKFNKENEYR